MISELKELSPLHLPDEVWATLERAYRDPPRAYHTLEHVLDVARHFARETWQHPHEVFVAVLFHDAVYDVHQHDNEEQSARLAERAGLTGLDLSRVRQLITLTARHGKLSPADVDDEAARFLDCDMAILGSDRDTFTRYEQQIAQEYVPVVGRSGYLVGRRQFLEKLLARDRIFLSDAFHQRLDARARDNLRAALA